MSASRTCPITPLKTMLRDWLCSLICGKRIWSRDVSIENDALRIQNDRLRELLQAQKTERGLLRE